MPQHHRLATPEGVSFKRWFRPSLATSPNGTRIAYIGDADGRQQLSYDDLTTPEHARVLHRTLDAEAPFFSQDGNSIAFFRGSGPPAKLFEFRDEIHNLVALTMITRHGTSRAIERDS